MIESSRQSEYHSRKLIAEYIHDDFLKHRLAGTAGPAAAFIKKSALLQYFCCQGCAYWAAVGVCFSVQMKTN